MLMQGGTVRQEAELLGRIAVRLMVRMTIAAAFGWTLLAGCAATTASGTIFEAAKRGDAQLRHVLAQSGADVNVPDGAEGKTALHAAAASGSVAVVQVLLAAGANANARSSFAETPLHSAAAFRHTDVAESLISAGADVDVTSVFGDSPLHYASMYKMHDDPKLVQLLIAAGADVTAKHSDGATPLHMVVDFGNTETARALVAAGADVNARDSDGKTPLHRAARFGRTETAEMLIVAGADVNARDQYGNTVLDATSELNKTDVAALLRESGATGQGAVVSDGTGASLGQALSLLGVAALLAEGASAGVDSSVLAEAGTEAVTSILSGPDGATATTPPPSSARSPQAVAGGKCEISGWPSPPGDVANLGLAWCPSSVDFQLRAFALQAASAKCALASATSSTPEQITARHMEVNAACDRLDALQSRSTQACRCPTWYRP